ncbi:MAG: hypothetical protein HC898_08755 [Phycisphaerales bacterium]|nr:hypothetical protein [Phycisphaerales bacterium]
MSLREVFNRNQGLVAVISFLLMATALFVVYKTMNPSAGTQGNGLLHRHDGKTWFMDKAGLMPFERDGQPVYKVMLFTDGGSEPFVGYLERYSPEAAKQILQHQSEAGSAENDTHKAMLISNIKSTELQIKRPGAPESQWIKSSDPAAPATMSVKVRPGNPGPVEPVRP